MIFRHESFGMVVWSVHAPGRTIRICVPSAYRKADTQLSRWEQQALAYAQEEQR